MPRAAQVSAEGAQAVRVGALGRQDDEVPRQGRCPCRSSRRPSFAGVDIGLFSAGSGTSKKFAPAAVKAGTVDRRQLVGVPHGCRCAARRSRDQPRRDLHAQGHHREPELLGDHLDHAALARASQEPDQADDHLDVPGRVGRRARPRWKSCASRRAPISTAASSSTRCCRTRTRSTRSATTRRSIPPRRTTRKRRRSSNETRKIFGDPNIAIGITCVRIPVLRAHCVSVTFECEKPITPEEVRAIIVERARRAPRRRPGAQLLSDARGCFGQGRDLGRPHPPRLERLDGPLDLDLLGRRSALEGRRVERRADRREAVGVRRSSVITLAFA